LFHKQSLYFLIIIIYYHTAWSSSGLVCTASSEGFITGVKKGRLFERSEFLPFSREWNRSSRAGAAL